MIWNSHVSAGLALGLTTLAAGNAETVRGKTMEGRARRTGPPPGPGAGRRASVRYAFTGTRRRGDRVRA